MHSEASRVAEKSGNRSLWPLVSEAHRWEESVSKDAHVAGGGDWGASPHRKHWFGNGGPASTPEEKAKPLPSSSRGPHSYFVSRTGIHNMEGIVAQRFYDTWQSFWILQQGNNSCKSTIISSTSILIILACVTQCHSAFSMCNLDYCWESSVVPRTLVVQREVLIFTLHSLSWLLLNCVPMPLHPLDTCKSTTTCSLSFSILLIMAWLLSLSMPLSSTHIVACTKSPGFDGTVILRCTLFS